MHFTLEFVLNFCLSFAGFLMVGIALCHGSWRNQLKTPYELGGALILVGHVYGTTNVSAKIICSVLAVVLIAYYVSRRQKFKPVDVRDGHNILSLLAGAALFALTVQLHAVLFGVAVFRITG
jgi:uncharacterized membrane protein